MPNPLPSNVQSGINSEAYVQSPTSPVDIAGDAFFNYMWAPPLGASINDPNVQTRINLATLSLKDTMSFVLSASPTYGRNVVAATAAFFSDQQVAVSTGYSMDASAKVYNDLISIEQNAKAGFGSSVSVMSFIFGALGFADIGAPGFQAGQQFGQNLGASMDSANPPTVSSTVTSFLQLYAAHPF